MYYGGYYGMYWDPTYILVIIGMVICLLASARVKSTYAKFNRVRSHSGITAAEAAEKILHGAGIYDQTAAAGIQTAADDSEEGKIRE